VHSLSRLTSQQLPPPSPCLTSSANTADIASKAQLSILSLLSPTPPLPWHHVLTFEFCLYWNFLNFGSPARRLRAYVESPNARFNRAFFAFSSLGLNPGSFFFQAENRFSHIKRGCCYHSRWRLFFFPDSNNTLILRKMHKTPQKNKFGLSLTFGDTPPPSFTFRESAVRRSMKWPKCFLWDNPIASNDMVRCKVTLCVHKITRVQPDRRIFVVKRDQPIWYFNTFESRFWGIFSKWPMFSRKWLQPTQ